MALLHSCVAVYVMNPYIENLWLKGLRWGFSNMTGLKIIILDLYSNWCKFWPFFWKISDHLLPRFFSIATLFTQIWLRIPQKNSHLWPSVFLFVYLSVLTCLTRSMYKFKCCVFYALDLIGVPLRVKYNTNFTILHNYVWQN
jgi:hypothetical protein